MSSPQVVPAPQQPESPESIPVQEESLSPEWVYAITNLLSHSSTSEIGQRIKKWIFYQAFFDYTNLVITWDPIEFAENRNHQKYEDSNGNITHLQSNTVKQLTSLMNYMIHLIKQDSVRELDLAMCFPIFKWLQDEKPLDQSEEVLMRNPEEP